MAQVLVAPLVPPTLAGVPPPGAGGAAAAAPGIVAPTPYVVHPLGAGNGPWGPPGSNNYNCNDRGHCGGPHNRPCTWAGFPFPGAIPHHAPRKTCIEPGLHIGPYRVCGMCDSNIRRQQWFVDINRDLTAFTAPVPGTVAQGLAPNQPINTWTEFLTPRCRECEKKERILLWWRWNKPAAFPAPPEVAEMIGRTQAYPFHTCTCLYESARGTANNTLCIRHRFQAAGLEHNVRLADRQQNDAWLRDAGRSSTDPTKLKRVSQRRFDGRETRKVFRGCRCGVDIRADGRPRKVALCLGCEGIVSPPQDIL